LVAVAVDITIRIQDLVEDLVVVAVSLKHQDLMVVMAVLVLQVKEIMVDVL
jgi:hypothetical protein